MTSYEGLFLATGRAEEGRALLRAYAATVSEGMLANTADTGATEYNTADATLWFIDAIDRHVGVTGDLDLAASVVPVLDGVIKAHVEGTRYGIGVDPADGLLTQGQPGYALTWMDARVDGVGENAPDRQGGEDQRAVGERSCGAAGFARTARRGFTGDRRSARARSFVLRRPLSQSGRLALRRRGRPHR